MRLLHCKFGGKLKHLHYEAIFHVLWRLHYLPQKYTKKLIQKAWFDWKNFKKKEKTCLQNLEDVKCCLQKDSKGKEESWGGRGGEKASPPPSHIYTYAMYCPDKC